MTAPFARLTDKLYVAGQIDEADIAAAAAAGVKTIVNNRLDDEELGQPAGATIAAAAARHGLGYVAIPVGPGGLREDDPARFAAILEDRGPALAYCKTGFRSAALWAIGAAAAGSAPADLVATAAEAGFDLSGQRPMLEAIAEDAAAKSGS